MSAPRHSRSGRLLRFAAVRQLVRMASRGRTADILADIEGAFAPGDRVLDVGAGSCTVAAALASRGLDVVAVDVEDLSCVDGWTPVLYDGRTLPFASRSFEVALLVTVLHHLSDPEQALAEAGRVARRVIVQEDVYEGEFQRRITLAMDSLTNLQFRGHPHSNRDDRAWRETFDRLGFRLRRARLKRFWWAFSSATYVLESPRSAGT